ncbi:cytochrome c oxidase subunit 3 [Rhizobium sp. 2YAF20]|uniref:cytochrome c oxidase subunit 3 n=1 Tax=Rhizobium sp. 2YAF20 TaxID=3233027 RepID=UPI003F94DE44
MAETAEVTEPYRDGRQQRQAATMGMYIFLGSEIMLFGGIAAVLLSLRLLHSAEIVQASRALHFGIGGLNTVVLLTSSLSVAFATEAAKTGKASLTAFRLAAASVCGLLFLAIKAYEYHAEFAEGLLPVPGVQTHYGSNAQHLFMNLYLVATGLHALHLTIGIVLLCLLVVRLARDTLPLPQKAIVITLAGLYWHLIDVIWICLYPILYLAR